MNRGDTYNYCFKLYKIGVTPTEYVDGSQYTEVEVQFNRQGSYDSVTKLLSEDEVSWDSTNSCFVVPLSQEDTFTFSQGTTNVQVRVYINEMCKGSTKNTLEVGDCLSGSILE